MVTGRHGKALDKLTALYHLTNDSMSVIAFVNATKTTSVRISVDRYHGANVLFSRGHASVTKRAVPGITSGRRTGGRVAAASGKAGRHLSYAEASSIDTLEPGSCMVL